MTAPGVAVFLRDPDLHGLAERLAGVDRAGGRRPVDAKLWRRARRSCWISGVRDMIVMSSTRPEPAALEGYGLRIVGWRDMDGEDQS